MTAPIDPAAAARLGRAAADNALELIDEANLLHEHGHAARSFALTVLAAEELAKAWGASVALVHDEPRPWAFDSVVKGHHTAEIDTTLFLERLQSEMLKGQLPTGLGGALRDLLFDDVHGKRKRATYVDLEDGNVKGPDLIAADAEAQEHARALRESASAWTVDLGALLRAVVDSARRQARRSP
jgi:AbiV family abortive infection protein